MEERDRDRDREREGYSTRKRKRGDSEIVVADTKSDAKLNIK